MKSAALSILALCLVSQIGCVCASAATDSEMEIAKSISHLQQARSPADQAGTLYQEADRLAGILPASQLSEAAGIFVSAANCFIEAGSYSDALNSFLRAISVFDRAGQGQSELLVNILLQSARTAEEIGNFETADNMLDRGRDLAIRLYGPDGNEVLPFLQEQTVVKARLNQLASAEGLQARIAQIKQHPSQTQVLLENARTPGTSFAPSSGPIARYKVGNGKGAYSIIRVFFGTNRKQGQLNGKFVYGSDAGTLSLGYADVAVPLTHKYGELETAGLSVFGSEDNPDNYIVTLNVKPLSTLDYMSALQQDQLFSGSREAVVFVHGFNVSFDDDIRRVAQLTYDLGFSGTPITYSWPSAGNILDYWKDEDAVAKSQDQFDAFLRQLISGGKFERIHIVAHSMGNRLLINALSNLAKSPVDGHEKPFDQLIFAAPDVSEDTFRNIAPLAAKTGNKLTLYASSNDFALSISSLVNNEPRAGAVGGNMLVLPSVDSIDMSTARSDILGHSYYGENSGVIADIVQLLWKGIPPDSRCGISAKFGSSAGFAGWEYHDENCDSPEFLRAVSIVKRWNKDALNRLRSVMDSETPSERAKQNWPEVARLVNQLLKLGT